MWIRYRSLVYVLAGLMLVSALGGCKAKRKTARKAPVRKTQPARSKPTQAAKPKKTDPLQTKYAEQLKVSESAIQNLVLYGFVDDWKGVPYRYGGMSSSGVDCSGFSGLLYKEVYQTPLKRVARDIYGTTNPVAKARLQEGDLVFFSIKGKKASHMGVYLQNGYFVHASSSKGVVISHLENPYYQKYFDRGGRMP